MLWGAFASSSSWSSAAGQRACSLGFALAFVSVAVTAAAPTSCATSTAASADGTNDRRRRYQDHGNDEGAQQRAPAEGHWKPPPPPQKSQEGCYDVAVVGAGVVGLSTAWHLAKLGRSVVVLERETVGAPTVASSVNAGMLENCYSTFGSKDGDDPRSLLAADALDDLESYGDLDRLDEVLYGGTLAIYADLARDNPDMEFERMGLLELLESPEQVKLAAEEWELPRASELLKGGLPLPPYGAVVDVDLLREMEPTVGNKKGLGAVIFPNCATTHPAKTMRAMKTQALTEGAVLIEGVQVDSLRRLSTPACIKETGAGSDAAGSTANVATDTDACSRWVIIGHSVASDGPNKGTGKPIELFARDVVVSAGGLTDAVLRTAFSDELGGGECERADTSIHSEGLRGKQEGIVPVVPVIGQMFSTAPESLPGGARRLKHLISSSESTTYWETHDATSPPGVTHERNYLESNDTVGVFGPRLTRHLYGKQTREGQYLFGGDRRVHPPQTLEAHARHPLPRIVEDMHESCHGHAIEAVPAVGDLPVVHRWSGVMSFSPDGIPIIGRVKTVSRRGVETAEDHSSASGLWVATGLCGCGFMRGAMTGLLLAEVIGKGPHMARAEALLTPADPARFRRHKEACSSTVQVM